VGCSRACVYNANKNCAGVIYSGHNQNTSIDSVCYRSHSTKSFDTCLQECVESESELCHYSSDVWWLRHKE
jgi:hypothetical protein